MDNLGKGRFYGGTKKQWQFGGLTIVDSAFRKFEYCPWHYHQNVHFAFTTSGSVVETHRKKEFRLSAGCLLYNHSAEPHCNSNYAEFVSALQVDIDPSWFKMKELEVSELSGAREVKNPLIKNLFAILLAEINAFDNISALSIDGILVRSLVELNNSSHAKSFSKPLWVTKIKELLYDRYCEHLSLQEIAMAVNIHPVYLCQQFPFHFHCGFGEYIRKIRIEKAVESIMQNPKTALTEISYSCGFADQSHFIRIFKKNMGITPSAFREIIRQKNSGAN
jgi:AraC family transcriptional regulator